MPRRCLECGEELLSTTELRRQRCSECVRFEYWNDDQQERDAPDGEEEDSESGE